MVVKVGDIMDVSIYSEPIFDVTQIVYNWFGMPQNTVVNDILILFSYLLLFTFLIAIFSLLFKGGKK